VPREWDFVADDARSRQPAQLAFDGVRIYYQAAHRHFSAHLHHGTAGAEPPPYRPHGALRLQLPDELRTRARERLAGAETRIALLPAGSSEPSRYPSARSWELVVHALCDALPNSVLCLLGKLERDTRTSTSMAAAELERIAAAAPRAVSGADLPLLEQLALAEACDVFVAPHTGFGMAVLAVGTPWLALSGGPWHEWFFNDVPFYSVIPDTRRYPTYSRGAEPPALVDDDGTPRTPSMTRARIEEDLPELVEAARMLVERRLSYDDALRRYFPTLLQAYGRDRSKIFSLDSVHERYI